jgi:hypothetical protein
MPKYFLALATAGVLCAAASVPRATAPVPSPIAPHQATADCPLDDPFCEAGVHRG